MRWNRAWALSLMAAAATACAPMVPPLPGAPPPSPPPTILESLGWIAVLLLQGAGLIIGVALLALFAWGAFLVVWWVGHAMFERFEECTACEQKRVAREHQEAEEVRRAEEIIRQHDREQR